MVDEINPDDILHQKELNPGVKFISKYFIEAAGKRIVVIGNDFDPEIPACKLQVDYLILRDNPKVKFDDINKIFEFKHLIFDSSNSWWLSKEWTEGLKEKGIKIHNTRVDGAFIQNLR